MSVTGMTATWGRDVGVRDFENFENKEERVQDTRPDVVHFAFLAPRETGLSAPEFAVARTFGFSCFGFFASLLPRLLSPLPIMFSQVEIPARDMREGPFLAEIKVA